MGKKKEVFVDAFGDAGQPAKKKKLKKDGFFKKLKAKIDELFDSENLTFNGKVLMLLIYGMVSSIGLIAMASMGDVIVKLIWAFARFTADCPTFGPLYGICWFTFVVSFLSFLALMILNEAATFIKADNDDDMPELLTSIFEIVEEN
jgi:hypothetical protein